MAVLQLRNHIPISGVQVKKMFPETRRAVMYWPTKLQDLPLETIRHDMDKIHQELAPCDVVMADIQADTSDKRVNELLEICRSLELGDGESACPADCACLLEHTKSGIRGGTKWLTQNRTN